MEKLNKYFIKSFLFITLLAFTFASCSDDDDDKGPDQKLDLDKTGAFVLGEGQSSDNNAKLGHYSIATTAYTANVFAKQNKGLELGKTAQDILIHGGKVFITVTNSNMIFVTDMNGVVIKEISLAQTVYNKPRFMAEHKGYVYISCYSGHIVRLNTSTLEINEKEDVVQILPYPEQMTVANGKLYVVNSRYNETVEGGGKTVTVVDLNNFKKGNELIPVHINPTRITSDSKGNVYVLSWGAWKGVGDDAKSALSIIKAGSDKAEIAKLGDAGTVMALQNDKLLICTTDYSNNTSKFTQYDLSKVKENLSEGWIDQSFFAKEQSEEVSAWLERTYYLSIDPMNQDIYVSAGTYKETGAVLIFDKDGKYKDHFASGMLNTQKVAFMQGK